jgi:hypothetical protein
MDGCKKQEKWESKMEIQEQYRWGNFSSVQRILVASSVFALILFGLAAAGPSSGGVNVAGVQIGQIGHADALQVGVDTRNKRAWAKTSSFEILKIGATKIAASVCAKAIAIPGAGVLVVAACVASAKAGLSALANKYKSKNKGIWIEIGRCSSGRTGICTGTF